VLNLKQLGLDRATRSIDVSNASLPTIGSATMTDLDVSGVRTGLVTTADNWPPRAIRARVCTSMRSTTPA